jgi:hypothetical protein
MNRSFYDNLWQVELQVSVPILYRQANCTLSIQLSSELYSSIMMAFTINVDILDRDDALVRGTAYDEHSLGLRKQHDPFDMQLSIPYIFWVILGLYVVLFALEFRFVLQKNEAVSSSLRAKIKEEKRIEKLLE